MRKENEPLVSIVVITYNSKEFVLETLDSALGQTYRNIELIITDDCSTDETVNVCGKWIAKNGSRFARVELLEAEKNGGVSVNCNRGLKAAGGDWIKFIAGDDILLPECIARYVEHVKSDDASFYFSQMELMRDDEVLYKHFLKGYELFKQDRGHLKQFLKLDCLAAPTSFIRREDLSRLRGFDERFPMREDYPLWIKALKNNYKIVVLQESTVRYRNNYNSLSRSLGEVDDRSFYKNILFQTSRYDFERKILIPELVRNLLLLRAFDKALDQVQFYVALKSGNTRNPVSSFAYNVVLLMRPSFYKKYFTKALAQIKMVRQVLDRSRD